MDHKSRNLFDVVGNGDDETLQRLLLEDKEERNIATLAHGNTVLHEAAWNGFSRCVKVLCNVYPKELDENANKEKIGWKRKSFINRVNFCGFTALHLAAQNGHNQTLREILYAGCSTSIHNDYGDTPLHTACRYGHAGAVRILISAKCDVDAFNLNHDTPLHITCAMGRRKLTKLLLEAGAMQFQNLQQESPQNIAKRKNLKEILEIMKTHHEKMEKKMAKEAARNSKSPQLLPHKWSPYGCHFYPDSRKFPSPKLETLPIDPLQKGEQYFMDLAGNIRKGPVETGNRCYCTQGGKHASAESCRNVQKLIEKTNEKLGRKIHELAQQPDKNELKQEDHNQLRRSRRERSREKALDPLYPLLKIVGDKNKQMHLKSWLTKVYPEVGSNSDLHPSPRGSEIVQEVTADVHRESEIREKPRQMPQFDENGNDEQIDEDDDSYTDISDGENGSGSIASTPGNDLYDERFLKNFQHQQSTCQNESITSPSINSNQNIEMEMEKITKSLMSETCEGGLVVNRNPDVIKDHIQHSAKRSTKKIKSAITKPILASGDLYVNSFFREGYNDEDSVEIDELISKVHETMLNSSNVSTVSSSQRFDGSERWNNAGRSRNPLPLDFEQINKYSEAILESADVPDGGPTQVVTASLNDNNFILLDQLLKARKKFNQNYQQQLEIMNHVEQRPVMPANSATNNAFKDKVNANGEFTIPSSSTLV